MKKLEIDHGLVEIVMWYVDDRTWVDMYDRSDRSYISMTFSDDELTKIRDYINSALGDEHHDTKNENTR